VFNSHLSLVASRCVKIVELSCFFLCASVFCLFEGTMRCSLRFFRACVLNLRVDSCMFEKRFLMLAERLALGITLPFFLESL
jgi:hypothetical protein